MSNLYDTVSSNYIQNNLDSTVHDYLYDAMYNLSSMLADKNGRLNLITCNFILENLTIFPPNQIWISPDLPVICNNPNLPDDVYYPNVFIKSPFVYSALKELNTIYVDNTYSYKPVLSPLLSPLLSLSYSMVREYVSPVCQIYLDCYTLYTELFNIKRGAGLKEITATEIGVLNGNLRWLSGILEDMSPIPVDLIRIIRDLQKTLLYISSYTHLFDVQISYSQGE